MGDFRPFEEEYENEFLEQQAQLQYEADMRELEFEEEYQRRLEEYREEEGRYMEQMFYDEQCDEGY